MAITQLANELREILPPANYTGYTFVPVPCSKAIGDPEHDDRLTQLLIRYGDHVSLDIREIVRQRQSMEKSKSMGGARHTTSDLCQAYYIDESIVTPEPRLAMIVDDVLTTGAHFKAVQSCLLGRFPGIKTCGLFLARTVYP